MPRPETGFKRLIEALHRVNIPFVVAGSLASSVHGVVRSTRDIDLVAKLYPEQIPALVQELGPEFYADEEMMEEAIRRGRSFNLIHKPSVYKFDIFPLTADPFHQMQWERRQMAESDLVGPEPLKFPVTSAEDTILAKLAWFRLGGEVSEQQWRDVRGIVLVRGETLDTAYLRKWAAHLKVEDLLERALGAE